MKDMRMCRIIRAFIPRYMRLLLTEMKDMRMCRLITAFIPRYKASASQRHNARTRTDIEDL